MNTCKAALRILKARKLYVIIYLVLIGTMMFSISWQIMRGSTAAGATTYEPESARIAVVIDNIGRKFHIFMFDQSAGA